MAVIVQCVDCQQTFEWLDALARARGDALEPARGAAGAMAADEAREARLHVLAAVISWWVDRSLAQFPDQGQGVHAVVHAFVMALGEQGIVAMLSGPPHG